LKAGEEISLATLKYPPLYPVGTPEFEETAAGWVRYALLIARIARQEGLTDFDLEFWNELSFGSNFVHVNSYYDPPIVTERAPFLHPGGTAWEMTRRAIDAVKKLDPRIRCIWGFSNTTFFDCPVTDLPPKTDGQSYHPYGTGTRKLPEQEQHPEKPELNLEGYTPKIEIRMPEGWAHTFIQTESIMRLTNPEARRKHPPGTRRFYHYMTEHGVAPPECGVTEAGAAWTLKAKTALRSYCLWLNKGIDALEYFCAYADKPTGMGILPPDLPRLPADVSFESAATPPMKAIRNLTRAFRGSVLLAKTRKLDFEATALGEQRKIFDGDETHPPLWERQVFAALPFQANPRRFIVAAYVMTYDVTKPMKESRYRLTIRRLPGRLKSVEYYDPLQDRSVAARITRTGNDRVTAEIPVLDYPRLLTLSLAGDSTRNAEQ
jgi:hypothetical protein